MLLEAHIRYKHGSTARLHACIEVLLYYSTSGVHQENGYGWTTNAGGLSTSTLLPRWVLHLWLIPTEYGC